MSDVQPLTVSNEREVNAADLSIDQLATLKQQHEDELQELQNQLEQLHGAKNRYIHAKNVLEDMSSTQDGAPMLVPLTSSLYVPGYVRNPEKVLVELGTGYFCEKNAPEAKELLSRKMTLVDKSIESVEKVGLNKKKTLDQIVMMINYKVTMAREQQGAKN
eukprot:CAMPEP_0185017440 /NCGR_PEP_ID=MMETSP1103-20130426/398_1 /TAXON_ID=36769 /ORGANISM="Paraphysomonas bandaiensis, Strain Caron Lab Isolate" /LENGTH=160 /DNA_ID=CAMNT_0027546859 /DNA_START=10 /DNA_END=492 /DNA_ORIENTATION=+